MGLLIDRTTIEDHTADIPEFSLVLGGPLYQLLLRAKLIRPPLRHLGWRVGVITGIAWLPLLALTILGGRFTSGVNVPFLYDFEVHARLLFSLPILIVGELLVYVRMRTLTAQFVERRIVVASTRPAFDAIISSAMRMRNSVIAELALLLLVIFAGPQIWRNGLALHANTWYATLTGSELTYTPAGYWYVFFSVPLFQFTLLRWYYRIAIWCRFLFQVSRLDLNLEPLHPDRCCGLGFLGNVIFAFAPLLMAHSGIVAGYIADRVLHGGARLPDYKFELIGLAVFLLALVLAPLFVFAPKLNDARIAGLRTYGALASDYVVDFARKWTPAGNTESEPLLGSADIQSLADLANSFAVVREVKVVPFGKETIIRFLILIAVPLTPLAFTVFSPDEMLKGLVSILF